MIQLFRNKVSVLALASAALGNYVRSKLSTNQQMAISDGFKEADCYFIARIFTAALINLSIKFDERYFENVQKETERTLHLIQDFREELYKSLYIRRENSENNKAKLRILGNIETQLLNVLHL